MQRQLRTVTETSRRFQTVTASVRQQRTAEFERRNDLSAGGEFVRANAQRPNSESVPLEKGRSPKSTRYTFFLQKSPCSGVSRIMPFARLWPSDLQNFSMPRGSLSTQILRAQQPAGKSDGFHELERVPANDHQRFRVSISQKPTQGRSHGQETHH